MHFNCAIELYFILFYFIEECTFTLQPQTDGGSTLNPPTLVTGRRADTVGVVASLPGFLPTRVGHFYFRIALECLDK